MGADWPRQRGNLLMVCILGRYFEVSWDWPEFYTNKARKPVAPARD